jgi:hypothetical protein
VPPMNAAIIEIGTDTTSQEREDAIDAGKSFI